MTRRAPTLPVLLPVVRAPVKEVWSVARRICVRTVRALLWDDMLINLRGGREASERHTTGALAASGGGIRLYEVRHEPREMCRTPVTLSHKGPN